VEELPEPPVALEEAPKLERTTLKEMVALAANCSQAIGRETEESSKDSSQTLFSFKKAEIQEISLTVEKEKSSLEDVLLDYVKKSKGEIDLARCSSDLKTSYEDIEKALESLGSKGKIKVELRTEG
jgi:predicted CopG family antitoxin